MGNPIWFIFWLLVFIFLSFFVAFFASFFYIILYAVEVLIPGLSSINSLLLQMIQFPHYCAKAMIDCKSLF